MAAAAAAEGSEDCMASYRSRLAASEATTDGGERVGSSPVAAAEVATLSLACSGQGLLGLEGEVAPAYTRTSQGEAHRTHRGTLAEALNAMEKARLQV